MELLSNETVDCFNPERFNLDNYTDDIPIGCFLEVELHYPDELHDLHNNFPSVATKIEVAKEMLSEY